MEDDYRPTFSCPFGLMGLGEPVERIGKMEGGGGEIVTLHAVIDYQLGLL